MADVIMYTDGGARNNPGPAGVGIVIYEGTTKKAELSEFLGVQTNNWAEYEAVALGLSELKRLGLEANNIEVRLDSKLVAEQVMGNWKVKEPTLQPQYAKVRALIDEHFPHISFVHVPRAKNAEADTLANEAMDRAS